MTPRTKEETLNKITEFFCERRKLGALFLCENLVQVGAVEEVMRTFDVAVDACEALTAEKPTDDVVRAIVAWFNAWQAAAATGAKVSSPRRGAVGS